MINLSTWNALSAIIAAVGALLGGLAAILTYLKVHSRASGRESARVRSRAARIVAVVLAFLFVAGIGVLFANAAAPDPVTLHVQNDFRAGAWLRSSTRDGAIYNQATKPADGTRWLTNGTTVTAECWVAAESYVFTFDGVETRWSHWARLDTGEYLQMAQFRETTATRSEHVPGLEQCD